MREPVSEEKADITCTRYKRKSFHYNVNSEVTMYSNPGLFRTGAISRGGDSNIHCTCGRDRDQNAINGSRLPNSNSQEIKSACWCRSNDQEPILDDQNSIFPCILVHATSFPYTSVQRRKLVILIPVAATSTVYIGVAAPCI